MFSGPAKKIERTGIIIALIITVSACFIFGWAGGISAAWGAIIVLASFRLWRFLIGQLIERDKGKSILVIIVGIAKLVIIGWLLWYTVTKTTIEPLAFFLGLSSIVAAIFLEGFKRSAMKET